MQYVGNALGEEQPAGWQRYVIEVDVEHLAVIHAAGPAAGDTVVVTHEKVVRALLSGDLTFETAEAFGLVRLYGDDSGQERVRSSLASATAGDGTSPATDRGTTDLGL